MALTVYRIDREGAHRLLVLLHGWSAEQHHLAAYVPLVDPAGHFTAVSPRGLHDLAEGDGASWYDRTPEGPDPASFRQAIAAVDELIANELAAQGMTSEQCVIGGFSQGGFLALALATRQGAPRYGGVWAMCCGLPHVVGFPLNADAGRGTPALIQYGLEDPIIWPERATEVASELQRAGWDVTVAGYDMAHSQCIEMMVDARTWLAARA